MPGTSVREAMTAITGEFPELVHLPELPTRGPGGDMVGRTAAMLSAVASEFSVETTPTGWRYADLPGTAVRRAQSFLSEDLDTLQEFCGEAGSSVKVQLCGPITLASTISLRRGERVISDEGALRDLVDAHREAVLRHLAEVRRRLPRAQLIVQIDEPAMDAALQGSLPTQSGWGRLMPLEEPLVRTWHTALAGAIAASDASPWLHSCAANWPLELARAAGYRCFSGDLSLLQESDDDALGTALEAGMMLAAGVVPTTAARIAAVTRPAGLVEPIRRTFARLGLGDGLLASSVVVTPTCGLGSSSWPAARKAMSLVREAARILSDQLQGVDD